MKSLPRDKPSAKVSPVMDKIQEPVKEARVSPMKKEKCVAEEASYKQVKPDKKSKKNGNIPKKHEYTNGHDDHGHTAVKIHLDKLKVPLFILISFIQILRIRFLPIFNYNFHLMYYSQIHHSLSSIGKIAQGGVHKQPTPALGRVKNHFFNQINRKQCSWVAPGYQ